MHDHKLETDAIEAPGAGRDQQGYEWFYYIRIEDIAEWEAAGWEIVSSIGQHSVLGKWTGEGEPIKPT